MRALRAVPVYADAMRSVHVVASVSISSTRERDYAGWYASAVPVALVIADGEGVRATDLDNDALDATALLAEVPALAAIRPPD